MDKNKTILKTMMGWVYLMFIAGPLLYAQQSQSHIQRPVAQYYNTGSTYLVEKKNDNSSTMLRQIIDLKLNNASVEQALVVIAQKSNLKLMYSKTSLPKDKQITLHKSSTTVNDALWKVLEGTNLRFAISQNGQLVLLEMQQEGKEDSKTLQNVVIGQVSDAETGETLPGVNIIVKGTSSGTSTDVDGQFELTVPSLNETLVFSFIGYQRQEIPINGQTEINVQLQSATVMGNELVVTAFGFTEERRSINFSSAEVGGSSINRAVEPNFVNSLSGRVAGALVQGNTTGPGGSSRIIIRGNTSLAGDNQPLYVVDGMPINNTRQGDQGPQGRTVHGDRGDGISHINPSDIESMTILKGGQATALYGSRASNGVVLITTKQGSQGLGVEFNSSTMIKTISKYPDWQQEYGHGTGRKRPETHEESASSGRLSFGEPVDGQPYISVNGTMRPYSPVSVKKNMDSFYDTGTEFSNTLAFTGGADDYTYRLSLSNLDANALMPNSSYNRKTANLNMSADVNDRLNISTTAQYNIVEGKNRPQGGYATYNATWNVLLLSTTLDIRDLSPGYYEDSPNQEMRWNPSSAAPNAYWVVNKYKNEDDENRLIGNIRLTYDLMDNLVLRGSLGQDVRRFKGMYVIPTGTAYVPNGEYNATERDITETNSRLTINYKTPFMEKFNLSAMLGGKKEHHVTEYRSLSGQDFIVPEFYDPSNLASTSVSRNFQENATNSLFGSAEVNYERVIYLTITGRQDWFSTLRPENNTIFYPSIGGSLIMSDIIELPDEISFFKIRGSWAQIGSAIVPPYATTETYSFREGGFAGQSVQNLGSIPTPNLRPLENTTLEAGIDLELFDKRLAFDLSLYKSTTRDDIVTTEIAQSSGYSSTRVNIGELDNRGIEFMVRGNPIQTSKFLWDVSYNVAYNKSEVLQLAEGLDQITLGSQIGGGYVKHTVGKPYGTIYANEYLRNENGQIVFNSNSGLPVTDEKEFKSGVAPLSMGFSNTFNFNNFSLDILLEGRFGSSMYSNTHWYGYRMGLPKETLAGRENGLHLSGVDQDGQPFERTIPPDELRSSWYNNGSRYPGLFVHDNSFIKLREVTLSYNLPSSILESTPLQSATFSIVGRNLLNIYDPMPHVDPEAGNTSGNLQGLEGFGLPYTRNVGFNVSLNF